MKRDVAEHAAFLLVARKILGDLQRGRQIHPRQSGGEISRSKSFLSMSSLTIESPSANSDFALSISPRSNNRSATSASPSIRSLGSAVTFACCKLPRGMRPCASGHHPAACRRSARIPTRVPASAIVSATAAASSTSIAASSGYDSLQNDEPHLFVPEFQRRELLEHSGRVGRDHRKQNTEPGRVVPALGRRFPARLHEPQGRAPRFRKWNCIGKHSSGRSPAARCCASVGRETRLRPARSNDPQIETRLRTQRQTPART